MPDQTPPQVCPKCGMPLQQKDGRYGPFLGCTGYPSCKYIYKEPSKFTGQLSDLRGELTQIKEAIKILDTNIRTYEKKVDDTIKSIQTFLVK